MSARRWLPAAGVTLLAAGFTWLNRGERVVVDLGVFRVYRAPLTMVAFLAFLAGMLSMLALSLRMDRRMRDELRARGLLEPGPAPAPAPVPAASAWGVRREPVEVADAGAEDERTAAYPRYAEDGAASDERTAIYRRLDEDPAA